MRKRYIIFAFISSLLVACVEFEPVSPIPEIEYKKLSFVAAYDSLLENRLTAGVLEFSFRDGDADLGVYDEIHGDTLQPDSVRNGIFIDLYEKVDGAYRKVYIEFPIENPPFLDTLDLNTLLPYDQKMDRVGQNKTIQGIIRTTIFFTQPAPYDSMRMEFHIRDRALNKSNIEFTRDFTSAEMDSVLNLIQNQGI